MQNRAIASIVSLYDPIHAEVSAVPRAESPARKNEKSQNMPLYLESLKKTVLELKHSLIPTNEKKNTTSKGIIANVNVINYTANVNVINYERCDCIAFCNIPRRV